MERQSPLIAAIGAVSSNDMLGLNGWLPWDIPEELAYFEATVAGAALLVGRLTYESMPVVPEDTFVLSRQSNLSLRVGCRRVASVEDGLRMALETGKPVFVIGGASIYAAAWPYCQRFYLTRIEMAFPGDTSFPADIPLNEWRLVASKQRVYQERKTSAWVVCRFLQYVQEMPMPVMPNDCKLLPASAESP